MSFQTVSKRFETPWNQVSKGFLKSISNGFQELPKGFLLFLRQPKRVSYPMKALKHLDETLLETYM